MTTNKTGIGVHIGATSISVAEKESVGRDVSNIWERQFQLSESMSLVERRQPISKEIRHVAGVISERLGHRYATVNVALAAPFVNSKVFRLEQNPINQPDLDKFLCWRFKDEFNADVEGKVCTYQHLGMDDGKYLVLAQLCDEPLVQMINQSFLSYGIPINIIDTSYNFVHNFLQTKLDKCFSVVLLLQKEYSTFTLLDSDLRPVYVNSSWISQDDSLDDKALIKQLFIQIERNIYSWIAKGNFDGQHKIKVHIIDNHSDKYKEICSERFPAQCLMITNFTERSDYGDFITDSGDFSIERVAAACQ